MTKFTTFIKTHWKKISAFLIALISALGILFGASSCGAVTKATIRNYTDSNSVSVTISTNNPTNWTVSPDTDVNFKKDKE